MGLFLFSCTRQSVTVYSFVKWCRLPRIFQNRLVVYRRIRVVIGLINMLVCWTRVFPEIRPVTACVTAATFLTGRVDQSSLMSGYRESGVWMCYRKVKFEKVRVSSTTTLHSPHNLLSTSSTSLGSNSRHSANPLHQLTLSLPISSSTFTSLRTERRKRELNTRTTIRGLIEESNNYSYPTKFWSLMFWSDELIKIICCVHKEIHKPIL